MSRLAKTFLWIIGVGAALSLVVTVAAAAAVARAGWIVVQVEERGEGGGGVNLVLPAALVAVAQPLVPHMELPAIPSEAARCLDAVSEVLSALASVPDAILVEVESDGERVTIRKQDGAIVIDVTSPRERVHVSVPLDTARKAASWAARRLATRAEPPRTV
jgi:hypothetical protein